ncbi:hypothetical protein BKA01_005073 [Pseudonocardia eucalypti]|nr:hypothetical protein [Pseudonocardia eucalypti]
MDAGGAQHAHAIGIFGGAVEQGAFADAGFAADDEGATHAGARLFQSGANGSQLRGAPAQPCLFRRPGWGIPLISHEAGQYSQLG